MVVSPAAPCSDADDIIWVASLSELRVALFTMEVADERSGSFTRRDEDKVWAVSENASVVVRDLDVLRNVVKSRSGVGGALE